MSRDSNIRIIFLDKNKITNLDTIKSNTIKDPSNQQYKNSLNQPKKKTKTKRNKTQLMHNIIKMKIV